MVFTVKYRGAGGTLDYLELDVPSKSEVWPELKKRGITAISITEGAAAPKSKGGKSSGGVTLVVGALVVVAVVVCGLIFAFGTGPSEKPTKSKPAAQEQETVRKPSKPTSAEGVPGSKKDLSMPKPSGKYIEKREEVAAPQSLEELQAAVTNKPPKKVAFKNGAEQLIALATPSKPGERVPPLPPITDEGVAKQVAEAMEHVIKAEEGDSESTLEKKMVVAEAKEEFKELRNKEGFTFTEYLNAIRDQANLDADFLSEAHKMAQEIYHDEAISDEDYVKYRDQINEKLEERGLPLID